MRLLTFLFAHSYFEVSCELISLLLLHFLEEFIDCLVDYIDLCWQFLCLLITQNFQKSFYRCHMLIQISRNFDLGNFFFLWLSNIAAKKVVFGRFLCLLWLFDWRFSLFWLISWSSSTKFLLSWLWFNYGFVHCLLLVLKLILTLSCYYICGCVLNMTPSFIEKGFFSPMSRIWY